jgi:hypothetical protein
MTTLGGGAVTIKLNISDIELDCPVPVTRAIMCMS